MDGKKGNNESELFMIRLWRDPETDATVVQLRGKIQHVLTGKAASFSDWVALVGFMTEIVAARDDDAAGN